MKLMPDKQIAALTGTSDPAQQVAALRQYGLSPFVCPRTGKPKIFSEAVLGAMTRTQAVEFEGNMEAFK